MTEPLSFDPAHSAMLCMDYQAGIVSIYGGDQKEALLTRASNMLSTARSRGMKVIYVQVGLRPGLPEVSTRNILFASLKNSPQHQQLFQGELGAIHPAVAPSEGDLIITKHRVNAFEGTDLAMILRANDIDTLFLFGIATSGVVLSTMLHAEDTDYRAFVISDCCADIDQELHTCLIDKLFSRRATVITSDEFMGEREVLVRH